MSSKAALEQQHPLYEMNVCSHARTVIPTEDPSPSSAETNGLFFYRDAKKSNQETWKFTHVGMFLFILFCVQFLLRLALIYYIFVFKITCFGFVLYTDMRLNYNYTPIHRWEV